MQYYLLSMSHASCAPPNLPVLLFHWFLTSLIVLACCSWVIYGISFYAILKLFKASSFRYPSSVTANFLEHLMKSGLPGQVSHSFQFRRFFITEAPTHCPDLSTHSMPLHRIIAHCVSSYA